MLRGAVLPRSSYSISYSTSTFSLSDTLAYSVFDTIIVTYQTLRLSLQKEYKKRILVIRDDETSGDTIRVATTESSFLSSDAIFGSNIEKSGTLVRGFTVGTTKDFSLNSGLRLQLSGKLSDEIEVVAAVTDENTPIQPEGNTERLEELDKVFIQLKHKNAVGTFGDYQLQKRYGEFGLIDRKLQGLMGEFNYEGHNAYVSIASSKGKFNSNTFNGTDGVQGPYRLTGLNNERDIIIIAGSEKVFLDGIEMRRGEANDFTIDYSTARITFTPTRLITAASRISVDFEYTDRQYARNIFGTGVQSQFFENKLGIKVQYLREGDDKDSPLDIILLDSDKVFLGNAGDDRNKAVKSGVSLATPDSLGVVRGLYQRIDTLINGLNYTYYKYSPGDSLSLYNASFSYVGEQQGDYIRESLGNYRFIGIGQGNYMPVIFLPMPESKQFANIVLDIKPWEGVSLSLEYAGSLWDRNLFSSGDDGDNYGHARNIFLKADPREVEIGKLSLGRIGFSYKDRFIQDRFTSPDRFNDVEFNRNYNSGLTSSRQNEQLREFSVTLLPNELLTINSTLGLLRTGSDFASDRYNNTVRFTDRSIFNIEYNVDYVNSKNISLTSKWLRQKGNAFYTYWKLKPGLEFLAEDKLDKRKNIDSLISGSLKFYEVNPYLEIIELEGFRISGKYSLRDDYFPLAGLLVKESMSRAQYYEMEYSSIKEVNSTLSLTLRKKKYTDEFKANGLLDNETILVRSQSRFRFFDQLMNGDLYYEVSTQRSAKLEKVFIRVEQGQGNYKYLGDLNNNGIADESDFEPTLFDGDYVQLTVPTEELFPVIDLKTSTRWKINFSALTDGKGILGSVLNALSTETFWRIEENSREEDYKKIYLLDFSAFQNEQNTIRGSNYIQQDILIYENDQDLSFRIRFNQRKSLNQFSGGVERAYNRERSLRIKFRMIQEVSNQTEIINTNDNVSAPINSNRKRRINSNNFVTDFSYRPAKMIEVGFKIKVGKSEDSYPLKPTIIDLNSQSIRFNLSFAGSGRLRVEVERNELIANTDENFLPFELTGGNLLGKNYFWRLNFDYRLSANLQSTVSYDGRIQGGGKAIHTARAEVRAYF
ncbi:MAG: hypothetical protein IPM56_09765 [Ignavibacteriales bacterium]|nr:MAG: hypothetical protein IPM56_09765 [Ignavibacteriales bacterium]